MKGALTTVRKGGERFREPAFCKVQLLKLFLYLDEVA